MSYSRIEGKFYPVGKYGFSLYQVDESLMSFTDGIKRSILVSGDGIHIVPSEEIQQYLKNFVITQKSIGLDEPPAEFYFDTEIGASTLTGRAFHFSNASNSSMEPLIRNRANKAMVFLKFSMDLVTTIERLLNAASQCLCRPLFLSIADVFFLD